MLLPTFSGPNLKEKVKAEMEERGEHLAKEEGFNFTAYSNTDGCSAANSREKVEYFFNLPAGP